MKMSDYMILGTIVAFTLVSIYIGWKLLQYVTYSLSNRIAKGIYDAKNVVESDKKAFCKQDQSKKRKILFYLSKKKRFGKIG